MKKLWHYFPRGWAFYTALAVTASSLFSYVLVDYFGDRAWTAIVGFLFSLAVGLAAGIVGATEDLARWRRGL